MCLSEFDVSLQEVLLATGGAARHRCALPAALLRLSVTNCAVPLKRPMSCRSRAREKLWTTLQVYDFFGKTLHC